MPRVPAVPPNAPTYKTSAVEKVASYKRPTKKKKPRYGAKQTVDDGTLNRSYSRLNRLEKMGVKIPGLDGTSYTGSGAESRRIKRALRKARDKKTTYSI